MTMPEPCQTCGSPVGLVKTRLPLLQSETEGELVDTRKCTNRACGTNAGRERSMGDIV